MSAAAGGEAADRAFGLPRRQAERAGSRSVPFDAVSDYVVCVDRVGQGEALRSHGAVVVVDDPAELLR